MASPGLATTYGAEQWSATLIESLTLQSALLRAGATRVTTDSRVVHCPRLKVNPAASWVAEAAPIPGDAGDADTLTLVPRKCADVLTLSNESISDASIDQLSAIGAAMIRGVATQVDAAAFSANAATATVPAGLLSYALPGTGAGGLIDIDHLLDGIGQIESHGGVPDTAFMHPTDITVLRKLKSTQNVYLLAPDAASVEGAPSTRVGGCQLIPSAGLAAGKVLICEARFISVAIRKDASVAFSGDSAFTSDSTVARVTMRLDWAPSDPNAFWLISP